MKMINCNKCSNAMPNDSDFCPFCGAKIEHSAVETNRNDIHMPADPTNIEAVLKRAFIFLEDSLFEKADRYLEIVLDQDPENAKAYVGKLMVDLKINTQEELSTTEYDYSDNGNYKKAIKYGDDDLIEELVKCLNQRKKRIDFEVKETIYRSCRELFDHANCIEDCEQIIQLASEIRGYKNIDEIVEKCIHEIERRKSVQREIEEEEILENENTDSVKSQISFTTVICLVLLVTVIIGALAYALVDGILRYMV